jgi:uncharacterized MAPEG superfamily protein
MPIEYTMLVTMTLFFMFAWLPGSVGKMKSFGGKWVNSNREPVEGKELLPWAGRVDRAYANLKDYFPAFVVAILLLGITGQFDEVTKWAAITFVVARIGHFTSYGLGSVTGRFLCYLVAMVANVVLLIKTF